MDNNKVQSKSKTEILLDEIMKKKPKVIAPLYGKSDIQDLFELEATLKKRLLLALISVVAGLLAIIGFLVFLYLTMKAGGIL